VIDDLRIAFEEIYREDRWSNGSGPGSMPSSTIEYRAFIERFIKENEVRSVTDLGCGDWQFSRLIDWSDVDYVGFDVVGHLIERNRREYGRKNIRFQQFEDVSDLPGGDLLLSKEVLQHLPNEIVLNYLEEIRRKYKFALLTNAIEPSDIANRDIVAGDWRPLRLDQPPFNIRGATVSIYFPQSGSHFWRNGIFLMIGEG
jgi:SAM-dependent methyltransferase